MSTLLVVAEHLDQQLNSATLRAVSAAQAVGADAIDLLVLSDAPDAVAAEAAKVDGIRKVLTVTRSENQHALAAVLAPQIAAVAADYSHVFLPSTTFGKDVAPRVAGLLGVAQVSDVMAVKDAHTFIRPMYAGNALVTVTVASDTTVVATTRTASWPAAASGGNEAPIEALELDVALPTHTRFVELKQAQNDRPDLQSAPKVISAGRGIGSEENFGIVYKLADKLGAAVGASRAAVDAGYCPSDMQVGQTGKIIAPDLYMAFGISGAIQHLTGIKDAGTIVAINKDAEAPIFEVADIGLVGDLFTVIPQLEEALG